MKAVIFDSSTLISFAMNGLLDDFRNLKKIFNGNFLITQDVERETIGKPLTIKRFALEALKIKGLLNEKVLEMPISVGISDRDVSRKTDEFLNIANSLFTGEKDKIKIIGLGEASCLALSKMLTEKKIENVIAIDERTTRMLCEKPENLKRFLEKKMHARMIVDSKNLDFFKGFKIIRSAELAYVGYKKKTIRVGNGKLLDSLLWAMKFKGCSISPEEIDEIKRIG